LKGKGKERKGTEGKKEIKVAYKKYIKLKIFCLWVC